MHYTTQFIHLPLFLIDHEQTAADLSGKTTHSIKHIFSSEERHSLCAHLFYGLDECIQLLMMVIKKYK